MQALYAWQQTGDGGKESNAKNLLISLLAPYDVYLFLLEFPFHFSEFMALKAENEQAKYYPDKDKIRRFLFLKDSTLATAIYNGTLQLKRQFFTHNWQPYTEIFPKIFESLQEQHFFQDYLVFDKPDFEQEKQFLEQFYAFLIQGNEDFNSVLEEAYSAWNDDDALLLREIERFISLIKSAENINFQARPVERDEDIRFGLTLFDIVSESGPDMEAEIGSVTENWDPARIAVLDLICIKMAIAEFLRFPQIPVKVSINEYLDICRDYSTPGSSRFLNGVLDKLRIKFEKQNLIQKAGRGLRDK